MKIYSGKKRSVDKKDEEEVEEELFQFDEDDDDDGDNNIEDEDEFDDDDDGHELSASDIEEEQNDNDIPDQKAWGKKRGQYYDADFIDKDYSTYTQDEEDLALAEEQEAKEIQKRLAEQLNDVDCDLEIFGLTKNKSKAGTNDFGFGGLRETKIKTDFENLDDRQKLQIFKKESPEFDGLVADFEANLNDLSELYTPLLKYAELKQLSLPIFKVLSARVSATNFYLTNLAFYLYMKVKKVQFKGHPIVKKLAQIKQLLNELDKKIENFKPDLEILVAKIKNNDDFICVQAGSDKYSGRFNRNASNDEGDGDGDMENDLNEDEQGSGDDDDNERRGITYQIAKNKGLTPYRKRENRNPRVKHRMKFRKAVIRRKGAVRTVRKETKRYDGEISGIKATVRKGIKLK